MNAARIAFRYSKHAGLIAAALLMVAGSAQAGPNAVVELFTSQGCSSCPPADALLAEYAKRDDVVALSFSVDYWDYLGWADTLATRDNTERQRAYAAARGERQVYTPQLIVGGEAHVVGSDRAAVERAVTAASSIGLPVQIRLTSNDESLTLSVDGTAPDAPPHKATIWLVVFDAERSVTIRRGENSGRVLTYNNVVRKMQRVAMWKGKPMTLDLPRAELDAGKAGGCAILLQMETRNGLPGRILGAAMIRYAVQAEHRN